MLACQEDKRTSKEVARVDFLLMVAAGLTTAGAVALAGYLWRIDMRLTRIEAQLQILLRAIEVDPVETPQKPTPHKTHF